MDEFSKPLEDNKFIKGFLLFGAIISIIIGLCILGFFISKVSESHSVPKPGDSLHLTSFGAFGDFIAGVVGTLFSLAGFFLLYLTFYDQRQNFHRERLENNYFEMIKFHRENVNELEYSYYERKRNNNNEKYQLTAEKRKLFKIIFDHFDQAWNELSHLFKQATIDEIYNCNYLEKIKNNKVIIERSLDLKLYAQIDLIYLIIFFGVSKDGKRTIFSLLENKYQFDFLKKVTTFAALKPNKESDYWKNWVAVTNTKNCNAIFDDIIGLRKNKDHKLLVPACFLEGVLNDHQHIYFYPDNYTKYYGGHQFRLGHYFRHLYQTVNFIDKEKYLSYEDKYSYIKILRGQLSNFEQIIFFLNSVSQVGRAWELENGKNPEVSIKKNQQLITKYNLIKNIPNSTLVNDINLLSLYPLINYEAIPNVVGNDQKRKLIEEYF